MGILDDQTGRPIKGGLTRGELGTTYLLLQERLTIKELDEIRSIIDKKIVGSEVHASSWLVTSQNWSASQFAILFEKAAKKNADLAAQMLGVMVWEAFERQEDNWFTGKYELRGKDLCTRTYWRPK